MSPILNRSFVVEAEGATLTVGDIRRMMEHLPDDALVMFDGDAVKAVTPYAGILHVDSGRSLAYRMKCSDCGESPCECR